MVIRLTAISPGSYLIDSLLSRMNLFISPQKAYEAIQKTHFSQSWKDVACVVVGFSVEGNAWCGADRYYVQKEFERSKENACDLALDEREEEEATLKYLSHLNKLEEMIAEGYFEVCTPRHWGGLFGWFWNMFEPRVVCPTMKLLEALKAPANTFAWQDKGVV